MWIGYIKAQVDYSELLFRYWVPVFLAAELFSFFCGSFGSQSEKLARRIAQTEADLKVLQQESDAITGRVDDPEVPRPLRQTRARKPFPQALPRDEHRLRPAGTVCPECGGRLSYLGEDAAEQLELIRSAFRVIRTVREKHTCGHCDYITQAPAPSRPYINSKDVFLSS